MNDRNDGFGAALRRVRSVVAIASVGVVVAACGSDIEGTYTASGDSIISSITLLADGKAKVDSPFNLNGPGDTTYTVEDDVVRIVMPDQQAQPFTFADDCLTHTGEAAVLGLIGKLCKGGKSSSGAASTAAAPAAAAGGAESYVATTPEGRMQLDLLTGGVARMKVTAVGPVAAGVPQGMTFDLSYTRNGNDVVLQMPFGEPPMQLVRTGRDLTATVEGETQRFVRQ